MASRTKAAGATAKQVGRPIVIPAAKMEGLVLSLEGTSPLIVHKFSEKAKRTIREKRARVATKTEKALKGPAEIAEDVMNCHLAVLGHEHLGACEGRFGFPSRGFKGAAVRAATMGTGMTMTEARMLFFVTGEVVPITCEQIELHEDPVKVGVNTTDLRYRPYYLGWTAEVGVRYNPDIISIEQIVNLFDIAGQQVGIGENRPGKTGDIYGCWKVCNVQTTPIAELPAYAKVTEDNDMLARAREIAQKMGAM